MAPGMTPLHIYLCNEVVRALDFPAQCRFARETGYDGLEIAPFTLAGDPTRLTPAQAREFRSIAEGEGVAIKGLHWLLAAPAGLSITAANERTSRLTREAGRRLIGLCAELGGSYLVHGSPQQRTLPPGKEAEARARGIAYFAAMAGEAQAAGLAYVIEPLSRLDTAFVTTVDEALAIIAKIGSPALKTMVDCYAAAANGEDVPGLIDRHLASSEIFHVHFNDDDKRGPGEGGIDFAAVLAALRRHDYAGAAAVEPFVYMPDGPGCAARAIGYLRGIEAGLRNASDSMARTVSEPS